MQHTTIIDLGSLKLKISIFDNQKLIFQESYLTLMGKDLNKHNEISSKSIELTDDALQQTKTICKKYKVNKVKIIGTEALRKISNLTPIFDLLNKYYHNNSLDIISQEDEAKYLFQAIESCFDKEIAICDIGGGSVQLMFGNQKIESQYLLKTGTYALQQKFSPDNNLISEIFQDAINEVKKSTSEISKQSDILVFGTTCMKDFILSCSKVIDLGLVYENKIDDHEFYITISSLELLLKKIRKFAPDNRNQFYPEGGYFIYGADYLLLNVIEIAKQINATKIYPTNFNTSYAFIK